LLLQFNRPDAPAFQGATGSSPEGQLDRQSKIRFRGARDRDQMSMGTFSCAGAAPVVAHKTPLTQNAAVMLEVTFRQRCPMRPFVSMALILAFTP
jgi:hypothetical protein